MDQQLLSQHCKEAVIVLSGCLPDSAGLLHQMMDQQRCHGTVTGLAGGCQEAVPMTVQDYCIRSWTRSTVTALSGGFQNAVRRLSS